MTVGLKGGDGATKVGGNGGRAVFGCKEPLRPEQCAGVVIGAGGGG